MRAFISYSHKDAEFLSQLHEHLAAMRRQGILDTWTDRAIPAGDVIDDHVDGEIEQAQLYLLLVSSAFIASDYCIEKEFARALERQKSGKARIVPIIIRECDWRIPELRKFKALPEDGKAVESRHWHNRDEGFRNVADGLRSLLAKLSRSEGEATRPNAGKPAKTKFEPDERHVTEEQRAVLRKLSDEIVDRLTARTGSSPDEVVKKAKGRSYGIVWSQFNERFGTKDDGMPSLLREHFEDAKQWLLQYRASKDKNFKRATPQKYRNTLTTAIYTLVGQLGWSKPELYAFAAKQVGYEGTIESLDDLGNAQLETVKDRVRYEHTKRKAKTGQAKARRNAAGEKVSEMSAMCNLDVGHIRDSSSTGDVHTYWLTVAFTNMSPVKLDGYTLEVFFPVQISVLCAAHDYQIEQTSVNIGESLFRKLTIVSRDTVFRGQPIQIVDRMRHPLSYKMDHALYTAAHGGTWQFRWNFYTGSHPPVSDAIPWSRMHDF